jgi:hypothetical protein
VGAPLYLDVMTMLNSLWKKFTRSWWGRTVIGALIGGFVVAFVGVQDPAIFVMGMIIGAALLFFLGRLQ